jgi:hypothetical protein
LVLVYSLSSILNVLLYIFFTLLGIPISKRISYFLSWIRLLILSSIYLPRSLLLNILISSTSLYSSHSNNNMQYLMLASAIFPCLFINRHLSNLNSTWSCPNRSNAIFSILLYCMSKVDNHQSWQQGSKRIFILFEIGIVLATISSKTNAVSLGKN